MLFHWFKKKLRKFNIGLSNLVNHHVDFLPVSKMSNRLTGRDMGREEFEDRWKSEELPAVSYSEHAPNFDRTCSPGFGFLIFLPAYFQGLNWFEESKKTKENYWK